MSLTIRIRVEEGDDVDPVTFDGSRIVIGRGAGNDVRLPDLSVSQRHAVIDASEGQYSITDQGSTNGTMVGGVKLTPRSKHLLRKEELIRVGRIWLEVRVDQKPATRDLGLATRDIALGLISRSLVKLNEDVLPRVKVVEGRDIGTEFVLSEPGRAYIVGRGDACDWMLNDTELSREHIRIVRRGFLVLLADLGSKNGTSLGEEPLRKDRDTVWKAESLVRLANTTLALEEPAGKVLAELESETDEPMSQEELAALPPALTENAPGSKRGKEIKDLATPGEGPSLGKSVPPKDPLEPGTPKPNLQKSPPKRGESLSSVEKAALGLAVLVLVVSAIGLYWLLRQR